MEIKNLFDPAKDIYRSIEKVITYLKIAAFERKLQKDGRHQEFLDLFKAQMDGAGWSARRRVLETRSQRRRADQRRTAVETVPPEKMAESPAELLEKAGTG
jgi:hypothetical protein